MNETKNVMPMRVLVPVADGSEELETVAIVDVLRRAGAEVILASVDGFSVRASKGVKIITDTVIGACTEGVYDAIVIPGGMPGAEHLRDSEELTGILKAHAGAGRLVAAVCAAPAVVLEPHGFLAGRKATCHPDFRDALQQAIPVDEPVVVDGNIVTSRGAGWAVDFALTVAGILYDPDTRRDVARGLTLE